MFNVLGRQRKKQSLVCQPGPETSCTLCLTSTGSNLQRDFPWCIVSCATYTLAIPFQPGNVCDKGYLSYIAAPPSCQKVWYPTTPLWAVGVWWF